MVARHYDPLIDLFNSEEEWTLTGLFALAARMEAEVKKGRAGKNGLVLLPGWHIEAAPTGGAHPPLAIPVRPTVRTNLPTGETIL